MKTEEWIAVNIEALVHFEDVPKMSESDQAMFSSRLAQILGEYLPTGNEWLDCIESALERCGLPPRP